ncbi:MAG: hypothetical protein U1F81_06125 [Verrucomicrobiaceae bacterium]
MKPALLLTLIALLVLAPCATAAEYDPFAEPDPALVAKVRRLHELRQKQEASAEELRTALAEACDVIRFISGITGQEKQKEMSAAATPDDPALYSVEEPEGGNGMNFISITTPRQVYREVKVTRASPLMLKFIHSGGVAELPLALFPKHIRERHGFGDEDAATRLIAEEMDLEDRQRTAARKRLETMQAENAAIAGQQRADAEAKAIEAAKVRVSLRVFQVTDKGVLADGHVPGRKEGWHLLKFDPGTPDVDQFIHVVGLRGVADKQSLMATLIPDGVYSYTNLLGAKKTVPQYRYMGP